MKITNLQVYDMHNSIRASGYPMKDYLDFDAQHRYIDDLDWKRAVSLASRESSEGHDNFLSGIIVSFDLTCTIKMWTEFERYHLHRLCLVNPPCTGCLRCSLMQRSPLTPIRRLSRDWKNCRSSLERNRVNLHFCSWFIPAL